MTHTFAIMEISQEAYNEITDALRAADYEHAIVDGVLDMQGIALVQMPLEQEKIFQIAVAARKVR